MSTWRFEPSARSVSKSLPIILEMSCAAIEVALEVLPDELTVAQDRDAVADRVDLVEEVRDEEDGDTLVAKTSHHGEEDLDLGGVQARGRLVEDENLGVGDHRAADRDELLQRDRDGREGCAGVEVAEPHAGEGVLGLGVGLPPVDAEGAADLVPEHHVLTDGEVRAEVDLLVHRGDAGGLRGRRSREVALLAEDEDVARVDLIDAGQRLDQGRLPRAVLTHEGVDLAGEEPEVDLVECLDAGERDRCAADFDDRGGFGHL